MAEAIGNAIRDRGFLLKSVPYGDHHRILNFLTENHGKVGLIAFSARNSRRRFSGALDFLHCLELEFKQQPRGALSQLLLCSLAKDCEWNGRDYDIHIFAMEWLRLLSQCLHDGQHVAGVFDLLRDSLKVLGSGDPFPLDVTFRINLLSKLGYHLNFDACLQCGGCEGGRYGFAAERGGILCEGCVTLEERFRFEGPLPSSSNIDNERHLQVRKVLDFAFESYLGIAIDRKDYF